MEILEDTIVLPLPSDEVIEDQERLWRIKLPDDFKEFMQKYNGASIKETTFFSVIEYRFTRFLCILEEVRDREDGWSDISVIESMICTRLTDDRNLIGIEVLPFGELFNQDYICLDFRENPENPTVCLWVNDESGEFEPVIYFVADNFTAFTDMLV